MLRIPGPTPCPPEVLQAMSRQMINHRSREFGELLNNATERLKLVFQTKNDLFLLTASGTGALEANIVNFLSPGDTVLATSVGVFGDCFAGITKAYGANVYSLSKPMGQAVLPDELQDALREITQKPFSTHKGET